MKKILLLLLLVTCYLLLVARSAQAATPTPTDTTEDLKDQLITNIASRVAQLKLVEKRGIIGKVTDVTNTQITLSDLQNNTRFVDVDELTKFSSSKVKGAYGISDIAKDTTLGILGLYNKDSRRILARFVNELTVPLIVHGGITTIDNEKFSINIAKEDGKEITADIENLTRTYSYTSASGYIRSGFSKIKENYNIVAIGVPNVTDGQKMTATRVIIFPEIPASPKLNPNLEQPKIAK